MLGPRAKFAVAVAAVLGALVVMASLIEPVPATESSATGDASTAPPAPAADEGLRISKASYDDARWPFVFDEGILTCTRVDAQRLSVLVQANGQTYALNGTAKTYSGMPDARAVTRHTPPIPGSRPVTKLEEAKRKEIFAAMVACEDAGGDATGCKADLRRRSGLSTDEFQRVSQEGIAHSWPPLTATWMDVTPFVQQGLALCR